MSAVVLGQIRPRVAFSGSAIASPPAKMQLRGRRCPLVVRASDDEDIVPIISGTRKRGFTPQELDQLRHPHLLGGKSIGQELAIIREKYLEAEAAAEARVAERLSSDQWYVIRGFLCVILELPDEHCIAAPMTHPALLTHIFFIFLCRDGDVWVGSRWNTLTVISLISILSTAGVGVFAWLSYGHLWGITPGLYH